MKVWKEDGVLYLKPNKLSEHGITVGAFIHGQYQHFITDVCFESETFLNIAGNLYGKYKVFIETGSHKTCVGSFRKYKDGRAYYKMILKELS